MISDLCFTFIFLIKFFDIRDNYDAHFMAFFNHHLDNSNAETISGMKNKKNVENGMKEK